MSPDSIHVLERHIGHMLTDPVDRPPKRPLCYYHSFDYQAKSKDHQGRVVAKVEWHQGELIPGIGCIVTNLDGGSQSVVDFNNGRGTAEKWIKNGKHAIRWTCLSCHGFDANQARLYPNRLAG